MRWQGARFGTRSGCGRQLADGGTSIEVSDHGPGIPDDVLGRLFDPFFTTKADGLGVGLAISRSILETVGGRITAANGETAGATFRVWLPASAAAPGDPVVAGGERRPRVSRDGTDSPGSSAAALVAALIHGSPAVGPRGRKVGPLPPIPPHVAAATDGRPVVLVLIPVQPGRPVFDLLTRGVMSAFLRAPGPPANVFVEYLYDLAEPPDLAEQASRVHQGQVRRPGYRRRHRLPTSEIPPDPGDARPPGHGPTHLRHARPRAATAGTAVVEVRGDEADSYAFVSRYLPSPGGGRARRWQLAWRPTPQRRPHPETRGHGHPSGCVDLTTVPLGDLAARVAALPERSVVVIGTCLGDSTGQPITYAMLMEAIAPVARGPIVVANDLAARSRARSAATSTPSRTSPRRPRRSPSTSWEARRSTPCPTRTVPRRPTFDARQLKRFGISEAALPAGTRFLFREPTRWESYRPWILFGVSALAIQSALILGLFVERRRRRASEIELDARATRHALVADVSSDFAHLPHDDIDGHVGASLAHVGTVLEVAECTLWTIDSQKGPSLVSRWRSEPGLPLPSMLDEALLAWAGPRLLRDEVVSLPDVSEVRQSALFHAGPRHACGLVVAPPGRWTGDGEPVGAPRAPARLAGAGGRRSPDGGRNRRDGRGPQAHRCVDAPPTRGARARQPRRWSRRARGLAGPPVEPAPGRHDEQRGGSASVARTARPSGGGDSRDPHRRHRRQRTRRRHHSPHADDAEEAARGTGRRGRQRHRHQGHRPGGP